MFADIHPRRAGLMDDPFLFFLALYKAVNSFLLNNLFLVIAMDLKAYTLIDL